MGSLTIPPLEENFTHILSHDLREPARKVSQFLKLLKLKMPENLNDDAGQFLQFAITESERLDGMIKGLSFVNAAKGISDSKVFFNIEELSQVVVEKKKSFAPNKTIKFSFTGQPEVYARRRVVKEVLTELLTNGIIHSDAQGELEIKVNCAQNSGTLELVVANSGTQPSEFWCKHSFELFQKKNKASKNYGVGLTRLKTLVEKFDGEIWMSISENGFTSVNCRLN